MIKGYQIYTFMRPRLREGWKRGLQTVSPSLTKFGVLSASLLMTSCAAVANAPVNDLQALVAKTSCEAPYVFKVDNEVLGDSKWTKGMWDAYHASKIEALGFGAVAPSSKAVCADSGIQAYDVVGLESGEQTLGVFYAQALTAEQIEANPNVTCAPTYTQIYQPPLTLGGSGQVIQVANGERCGN